MTTTTVVTGGIQQPGTNVIVIQQQPGRYGYTTATWGPHYLRQGLQLGGFAMGLHLIVCIGATGAMLTFAGIMMLSMDADKEFWAKFNRSHGPATVMGAILLVIGVCLMIACGVIAFKAKKKYKEMKRNNPNATVGGALSGDNPGHVYNQNQNQNPGQYTPVQNPGQHSPMPPVAAPYGMNVGGQVPPYPQPGVNPPVGGYFAGQPSSSPPQPSPIPGGQVPPYPQPGVNPPVGGYFAGKPSPYPPPQSSPIPGAGNPQSVPYPTSPYAGPTQYPSNPEGPEYTKPPPFAPDYKP